MAGPKRVQIDIPAPLAHQRPHVDHPARFKVGRCGRRWGKSWNGYTVACRGHGPIVTEDLVGVGQGALGERMWKGMAQGGDIVWISRDYTQLGIIWRKLWRPRWKGKLHGLIVDEAAHWDLDAAWKEVLRPTLVDYKGWSWIVSTTMLGSFFNDMCQDILDGSERYPASRWYGFHGTVDENPKIDAEERRALREEYVPGCVEERQELDAELVVEGGLAFPMFREAVHVQDFEVPYGWVWAAGFDWGYSNPGAFVLSAYGPDAESYIRWAWSFSEMPPYDVGFEIGVKLTGMGWPCSYVVADDQMWYRMEGPEAMWERFQAGLRDAMGKMAPAVLKAVKGPGSAKHRFMLGTEALRYKVPDGWELPLPPAWAMPKTTFHPDASPLWSVLSKLRRDPHDVEKVAKQDNNDHPFDAWTYLESHRRPRGERQHEMNARVAPGMTAPRKRKKPKWLVAAEQDAGAPPVGGRFRRRF
jgi:hypothetical protein